MSNTTSDTILGITFAIFVSSVLIVSCAKSNHNKHVIPNIHTHIVINTKEAETQTDDLTPYKFTGETSYYEDNVTDSQLDWEYISNIGNADDD